MVRKKVTARSTIYRSSPKKSGRKTYQYCSLYPGPKPMAKSEASLLRKYISDNWTAISVSVVKQGSGYVVKVSR